MLRRSAKVAGSAAAGLAALALLAAGTARAAELRTEPGGLTAALDRLTPGDTLRLAAGTYEGSFTLDTPDTTLAGGGRAVLDAGGTGDVLRVSAPGTTVRGLVLRNSGQSLKQENAGLYLTDAAERARVLDNRLRGNLIGVNVKGPDDALIKGNRIRGLQDRHMSERGNGVHVWNSPGAEVVGNDIRWGRDGIFVTTSRQNRFHDNRFRDLRYGVHYMYTNRSRVTGNVSIGNHAGYAIMFSKYIEVHGNRSRGDRDHGLMLNFANRSSFADNAVLDGGEKCAFVYNSNFNTLTRNLFRGCRIGIHYTAGSQDTAVFENAFVANRTQVKYVSTTHREWARDGRGNYWSDHAAFDLDGDGIADRPYRPNGLVDHILWRHPQAKLLLNSAAMKVLRWAQAQFPALLPGGVVDPAPLMRPPQPEALERAGGAT
jgi:nitrous oxidase accessory protein